MGKKRRKIRAQGAAVSTMTAALQKTRSQPSAGSATSRNVAENPAHFQSAIPLTTRADTLVIPAKAEYDPQEGLRPLPRSKSLALPSNSLVSKLSAWFRAKMYKPPVKVSREVTMTRRQLKDLRRQITVMERTLGRMS